jgi:hypothetical protein
MLIDDLDGSGGAETLRYTVDGVEYEIDLSEKNAQKFRATLEEYTNASRRVEAAPRAPVSITRASSTRRRSSSGEGGGTRSDLAEIRKWAQENGHQVAERGRIKKEIIDAYDEAHK